MADLNRAAEESKKQSEIEEASRKLHRQDTLEKATMAEWDFPTSIISPVLLTDSPFSAAWATVAGEFSKRCIYLLETEKKVLKWYPVAKHLFEHLAGELALLNPSDAEDQARVEEHIEALNKGVFMDVSGPPGSIPAYILERVPETDKAAEEDDDDLAHVVASPQQATPAAEPTLVTEDEIIVLD